MIASISGAALAGLMGSPHCIAMCGGFATACSKSPSHAVAWNLGRLTTYTLLGAAAGALGSRIPGPGWIAHVLAGSLTLWFAASLAGLVSAPKWQLPGLTRAASKLGRNTGAIGRYFFGMATSLLPCGLVYTALGIPMGTQDPVAGALAMLAFGLGTTPILLGAATGLRRLSASSLGMRRALAALVLVAGWWAIGVRAPVAQADTPPACHDS